MLSAARVTAEHPLIGVGPGNFRYFNREYGKLGGFRAQHGDRFAHCLYLEISAETGVPGILCFLAIVLVTLQELTRARRRWLHERPELANLATAYMLALVCYMTTGIFLHMTYARYFWLMLAVASATALISNRLSSDSEVGDGDSMSFANSDGHRTPSTTPIESAQS